jgi:hypothetical protein
MNAVKLRVEGLGHVPSIKNSMYAIVQKENRSWKSAAVAGFVSQLVCSCPTTSGATLTAEQLHSLIASLPHDDNWRIVSELHINCRRVPKGQEGAEITIEAI